MAKHDVETLAGLGVLELENRMAAANSRVQTRITRVQDEERDLTPRETDLMYDDRAELSALRDALQLRSRDAAERDRSADEKADVARQVAERSRQIGEAIEGRRSGHTPLLVSPEHVRSHAEAIRTGSVFAVEERAAVTVATHFGSAGGWASGPVGSPTTLRQFAGMPNTDLPGATAQMPSLTLPAGVAGVAETVAHGEFDDAAVVNLSALRYGRFSDVTSFVDEFDDVNALNQAHAVGIARDLNLADGNAIQTAAGTPTAFDAAATDLNVRAAILKVAAAVLGTVEDVVLFGTSAALAVVTGYAPTSGDDRGSVSVRVFGARVYVHEQAAAGNVYAFAPRAFRTFSSRLRSASVIDPTTGGNKFGQWLHSTPPGVSVVGGAAAVDVVTP